jgi:mannose-6-phosphate isomerase-like protein (cupin superfamily)
VDIVEVNKHSSHIDDGNWQSFDDKEFGLLRWKDMLARKNSGSNEFVFGYAEIDAGNKMPIHRHKHTETILIISGSAKIRAGNRNVEVGPMTGAQFPAGLPHRIEPIGLEKLCYIYTYACDELDQTIETILVDEVESSKINMENDPKDRWVVTEDFEAWEPVEPSKGLKGMCVRFMFGVGKGKSDEMMAGTCRLGAGIHYTLHYHDQPEIFYCLSGHGVIYVGDQKVDVYPGVAVYIGSRVVHGADAFGSEPLLMYWLYGTKETGDKFNWTPVEDIYTESRISSSEF